jgi:membrane protein
MTARRRFFAKNARGHITWRLLKVAAVNAYKNNCLETAKGVAYSTLFCFFPALTTLAAVLVQARVREVARMISSFLFQVAPPGTEEVLQRLFTVYGQRPNYLLVVAVAAATWAASGAITSLMAGFRIAYHIASARSFLKERAIAILLVFTSLAPICFASVLIVFGERLARKLLSLLPYFQQGDQINGRLLLAGQVAAYAVAFAAFVLVTALLYYLGPKRKQTFAAVLPGAVLATLLWLVATAAVGWYMRHVTNYNVLYGSVGASLALLVWWYVLAVIALFGCEFNAALERALAIHRMVHHPVTPVPAGRY